MGAEARITVNMTEDEKADITFDAWQERISVSTYVRKAIGEYRIRKMNKAKAKDKRESRGGAGNG